MKSIKNQPGIILIIIVFLTFSLFFSACGNEASTAEPVSDEVSVDTEETDGMAWQLVWSDEFDGTEINPDNWVYDTGAGGWGNNESQFYTDRPENARVEDGFLIIEALEEDYRGSDYTSARLKTQYKQTWTYGRFEARMKLPTGKGVWSAFWMLGEDIVGVGWPQSGEIDIMENIGEARTIHGTVHGPGYSGGQGIGAPYIINGGNLYEDFYVYAVEWEPSEIRWYIDDVMYHQLTIGDVPTEWVFDHPFFILLNLAIGGQWPGYPDETTVFPQQLVIDYVRVYEDPTLDLEALSGADIHVASITSELTEADDSVTGDFFVTVVDEADTPMPDVLVKAGWLGAVNGATEEAVTNADGVAGPFTGILGPNQKEFSFCVRDLALALHEYNKDANETNCLFVSP